MPTASTPWPLRASSISRTITPSLPRLTRRGTCWAFPFSTRGVGRNPFPPFSLLGIRHPKSVYLPRSSFWVGDANLRLGNWQASLENLSSFLAAAGASPYRLAATFDRAVALEGLGRDAEAGEAYRQVLLDRSAAAYTAEATFRLPGTEYRSGHFAAARDLYAKVLLDNTGSPFVRDAVFFTGECELALGRFSEAEKRYLTVLSLYPDSPYIESASFRLADIACRQDRPAALRQIDDFLARFSSGAHAGSALRLKGDILVSRKRNADAVTAYAQAADRLTGRA